MRATHSDFEHVGLATFRVLTKLHKLRKSGPERTRPSLRPKQKPEGFAPTHRSMQGNFMPRPSVRR